MADKAGGAMSSHKSTKKDAAKVAKAAAEAAYADALKAAGIPA